MTRESRLEIARRFEREVLPHVDVAYRMALTLTRDADQANDLVQDATLRALRAFASIEHTENLRSWLARVVHTTFLDRVRYERRRPAISIEEEGMDEAALGAVELEPAIFEEALDDDYEAALGELPDSWRAVVQLVDVEAMTYEEASSVLETPVGTVRSRLHRARQRLQIELCRRLRLPECEEIEQGLGARGRA